MRIYVKNTINNVFNFIETFPTTRTRILVTTVLIVATVITWLFHACDVRGPNGVCMGWEPSPNMLIFLSVLAGVDVAQYLSKGIVSTKTQTDSTQEDVTKTTDISEFEQEKG